MTFFFCIIPFVRSTMVQGRIPNRLNWGVSCLSPVYSCKPSILQNVETDLQFKINAWRGKHNINDLGDNIIQLVYKEMMVHWFQRWIVLISAANEAQEYRWWLQKLGPKWRLAQSDCVGGVAGSLYQLRQAFKIYLPFDEVRCEASHVRLLKSSVLT